MQRADIFARELTVSATEHNRLLHARPGEVGLEASVLLVIFGKQEAAGILMSASGYCGNVMCNCGTIPQRKTSDRQRVMKRQSIILLILFYLTSLNSFSQDSLRHDKKNYLDFLQYPDENSQNHLLMCNYQFFYSAVGTTIGARGTMASLGLNLARFFSTKIIIAAVADIKLLPGIWPITPSNNFTSEFNNSFIKTYGSQTDSANANVVQNAFNQQGTPIIGQSVFNAGIALSLFPQKYGGVLLQLKYGETGFQIHGVYGNKYVNNGANDKVAMEITGNWIYEITFKPVAFFDNTYINTMKKRKGTFGKSFVFSFYYERLNFKSAEFNGTKVIQMVSSDFIAKYGIDNRFGFKIGFALY